MAKKIKKASDLVTSKEQTRAGFISMALEKNFLAMPYIAEAKALRSLSAVASKPKDLLKINEIKPGLLTASGLSDKALKYLDDIDKTTAVKGLIEEFLEPAGDQFIDELVYRYLLIKGDALGGKARNLAGSLGERKFLRTLLSLFNIGGISYMWKDRDSKKWLDKPNDDSGIEKRIKAIHWSNKKGERTLIMNTNIPLVKKNIDVSVLNANPSQFVKGENSIIYNPKSYVLLGEIKGEIDPAGADEHWKTANSALNRIRKSFKTKNLQPKTFFVGAAIETSMANEIFDQIKDKEMSKAGNLTIEDQVIDICNWIVKE